MVIVELLVDVSIYKGMKLARGNEYIMSGAVKKQLLRIYPGSLIQTKNFNDFYKKFDISSVKDGDSIFMFRSGGIGDVIFMLPIIKYLKKNFKVKITVATSPMYSCVLENNPLIDRVIQMPFAIEELINNKYHLMFEGLIEDVPEKSQRLNAFDLFLDHAGIDYTKVNFEDKLPKISLSREVISKVDEEFLNLKIDSSAKRIGVQVEASSPIRTFPLHKVAVVIRRLLKEKHCVFAFGGKRQLRLGEYLKDMFIEETNFISLISEERTLEESIAYVKKLDVMVAPDSSFVHIAGAMGIPIVGLYGCFPSLLRMKYYKNAIGLDCNVVCSPSFQHGHSPCSRGIPSPCFSVISEEDILAAINHWLINKPISLTYPKFNTFINGELSDSVFNII